MFRTRRATVATAAAGVLLTLALGACSSSGSSGASAAKSAGQSALANPTYSAELAQLESQLLTAYQKNFSPLHPIKSMETAIHQVFPSGDAKKIATYAVHQLNTEMVGTQMNNASARQIWAQKVVTFALGSNPNATASPGSAVIPGTSPSASATSS